MLFDQEDRADAAPDEPSEPPRRGRGVARWLVVLAGLAVVALLALAVAGLWVRTKLDPSGPPGEEVAFEIPRGVTTSEVADLLAREGIITSGEVFRWYLRLKGGETFDAGLYHLQTNSAMWDVVDVLNDGPDLPPATNLTIPEGLWVREVAERVSRVEHLDPARFLELATNGSMLSIFSPPGNPSLEGLLYPDTYRVEDRETEEDVLRRMIDTFDQVATEVGLPDAQARVGYSPYEVIIVASLIEAETRLDAERPKIARVIYNRLEQGIPLGIDATFYFALQRRGGSLRQSDLEIDSPYNTRENAGLVPGPIAMPRRASLEAALNPEPGPWLYYVLQDPTVHFFTDDYDEFLRAKEEAQRNGLIP